ncbi:MAG: magnesium transporter [Verrucomicrobiales bacterium]|jgi:magnesium transporter
MDCLLFDSKFKTVTTGEGELIDRWDSEPGSIIWVRITGKLTNVHESVLEERFGIHTLALQDAKRDRHPPKFEVFDESTFLLFKTLTAETTDIHFSTIQIAMFAGKRFLITRASGASRSIEKLKKEVVAKPQKFAEGGAGQMAARLIRLFVERYLTILLELEPRLEELEEQLLGNSGDEILAELTGYKADLKRIRRIFLYHQQVLDQLRAEPVPGFDAEHRHWLNDVFEQQERASSLTLLYYELAGDLVDGFLSLASHRLNGIMKVLTIITAVFVPLGFLAGIYGMNFDNMPELHSRFGYFILIAVMASIATTLLLVFKKQKWL